VAHDLDVGDFRQRFREARTDDRRILDDHHSQFRFIHESCARSFGPSTFGKLRIHEQSDSWARPRVPSPVTENDISPAAWRLSAFV
jgi:hypothetical protein